MKKFIFIIIIAFLFIGCIENSADEKMAIQTEQAMSEANRQIGMPAIKNFQERKLAKMIFELRDREDLVTYTYIITISGQKIFLGKSIGYGLPYSVQYTNPEKIENYSGKIIGLPQADPNGLFMPGGLSATWVMLIDPKTNEPRPVYIENEIIVSPFLLNL